MNSKGQEGRVRCQGGCNKLGLEDCLGQVDRRGETGLVPTALSSMRAEVFSFCESLHSPCLGQCWARTSGQ